MNLTNRHKLFEIARDLEIPATKFIGLLETNPDYIGLSSDEDYDNIIKSFRDLQIKNRQYENPPAIIAILPKKSYPNTSPKWYYIKNDLLYEEPKEEITTWRNKKKPVASKSKRKVCKCKK